MGALACAVCRSPAHGDVFLSASGDTTVRLWDLRQPQPTLVLPAHAFEVLSADWCKYNDCIIATGSIDKSIKIWDVRQPQRELTTLFGHSYVLLAMNALQCLMLASSARKFVCASHQSSLACTAGCTC
jgi:WD40 repeat protein